MYQRVIQIPLSGGDRKNLATLAEYTAGMAWLTAEGLIGMDESGCLFVMHPKGHDLFEVA